MDTIGLVVLLIFITISLAPEGFGKRIGKIKNGYEQTYQGECLTYERKENE